MRSSRLITRLLGKKKLWSGFGLALSAVLATLLSGYTISIRTNLMRGGWPLDAPIEWRIWEGFTDQQMSIEDGSQPQLAIKEALERWVRVASLPVVLLGTTTTQEVGHDGTNLVTIANTANNRSVVGDAAGVMVVQMLLNTATNQAEFVDADLLLNPTLQWSTLETDDHDVHSILSVCQHEFGHAWNLKHTISRSSTMFYASGPDFDPGFNQLAWDDIAGVNLTYPLPGISEITGSISGQVTRNGSPVFGAFVVAVDESGALSASAISMQDGRYTIDNLPPGHYTLYVEPLDGPTEPEHLGDGIYSLPMTTDFLPRLYNDTTDAIVQVQAGSDTAGRNFQVTQGTASIDPVLLGIVVQGEGFLTTAPASITQGATANYAVAGDGVDTLLASGGLFFPGTNVSAGFLSGTGTVGSMPACVYPVTTTPDAVVDEGYPVFLSNGSQIGVVTGGFKIYSFWRFLQAFAQFANLPTATSGLFLINTDRNAGAAGQINLHDAQGAAAAVSLGNLTGSAGNLNFNLAPGGALLADSHGADFVGSLRARGDRRLGGTALFETPFGVTGVGPSEPAYSFIVPIEVKAGGATVNTGVALTNLDTRSALVFARAYTSAGAAVSGAQRVIPLAANGQLARFIADGANSLVPGLPADFDGNLVVTSTRRLGGAAIRTAPGVFTTLPVIQNRVTPDTYFAQFVHAGGLTSRLILVNPSPHLAARVVVQIRHSSGVPASIGLNGQLVTNGRRIVSIPPLGRVEYTTTGSSQLVGSVQVSSRAPDGNNLPVGGVVLFGSQAFGTTGVGESRPMTRMVIPVNRSTGIDTGLALVNADTKILNVHLEARDLAGVVVKSRNIILPLGAQLARFVNEDPLSLSLAPNFTGSLWIEVDGLIGAMSIRQSPGVLTTFPVITLEEFTTL